MAFIFKLPVETGAAAAEVYKVDPLLMGDNDGVRFLFDLAYSGSHAGGDPVNGGAIGDISDRNAGSFGLTSGQTVSYTGGGFDFAALTKPDAYVISPAAAMGDIWSNSGGTQYFSIMLYLRLPSEANWNTNAQVAPFLLFGAAPSAGYLYASCFGVLSQYLNGAVKSIAWQRQTSIGAALPHSLAIPTEAWGSVAQILLWRNAAGAGMRLKTADVSAETVTSAGAVNTESFAANKGYFGISHASLYNVTNLPTPPPKPWDWRLYRGSIENLYRSGRDPEAVADDDWARVLSRSVFS